VTWPFFFLQAQSCRIEGNVWGLDKENNNLLLKQQVHWHITIIK